MLYDLTCLFLPLKENNIKQIKKTTLFRAMGIFCNKGSSSSFYFLVGLGKNYNFLSEYKKEINGYEFDAINFSEFMKEVNPNFNADIFKERFKRYGGQKWETVTKELYG